VFPGTDEAEVEKAAKELILEKKNPKKKKEPEKPLSMGIKPMDKRGDINVDFN
jgi:hypothetical protein